jgi:alkanesulfonate monooxygenase SsuD/methylene tetrahydromethanopterin reductase-like flavin-dependent oxidoreductase (luciferase family)
MDERFSRLEEGLEVITRLVRSDTPASFDGQQYRLRDAQLQPKDHPLAITIGGNGEKRTLPLVARYADEWNGLAMSNDEWKRRNDRLNELLDAEGRDRGSVRRTLMAGTIFAKDQATLDADPDRDRFDEMRARGAVIGTTNEVVEILASKAEAGIEGVQLQWLDFDDIAGLELIASDVLPQLRR